MHSSITNWGLFIKAQLPALIDQKWVILGSVLVLILIRSIIFSSKEDPRIPIVNRSFRLEPSVFALMRWSFGAQDILDRADKKYPTQLYLVKCGSKDVTVLPRSYLSELNALDVDLTNSRKAHSWNMVGHLNKMNVILTTQHHVKILQSRLTPSLASLTDATNVRLCRSIEALFPLSEEWVPVQPAEGLVECATQALALYFVGAPTCDDQDFIKLCHDYTRQGLYPFSTSHGCTTDTITATTTTFVAKLFPKMLRDFFVCMLPDKWRMERNFKRLDVKVRQAVDVYAQKTSEQSSPCLASWMISDAGDQRYNGNDLLTRLFGSLMAGGTYSTGLFVLSVLVDLMSHPEILEEIREELHARDREASGMWNLDAFNSLHKLDSAMKETARMSGASLLVYSRIMEEDRILSDGTKLLKGSQIAISSRASCFSQDLYDPPDTYDAFRSYRQNASGAEIPLPPFKMVDNQDLRWGSGRWACPGRAVADVVSKIMLVKLLCDYDFKLADDMRPKMLNMHEFAAYPPSATVMMRRRRQTQSMS